MWRRGNKYGNKRTKIAGIEFSSRLEASVYGVLQLREKAAELVIEKLQDTLYLGPARFRYTPDFRCKETGGDVFWVEAKGFEDVTWRRNYRLWKIYGPGKLEIWKGSPPSLSEIVIPKQGICKTCGKEL